MPKKLSVFYSAMLLTAVNLLLRLAGTLFQVYLSGRIGAEGIGLLQLVMSIGSMAMVAGMAGIRTAAMYLTAEEIGKKQPGSLRWILSGCCLYSILCSGGISVLLCIFAPRIAENWVGNAETAASIRMFAFFLPVNCLCGVMAGYFTGANRIGTLAAVEVAEQICSIVSTMALLGFLGSSSAVAACQAVVMGSGLGACITLYGLTVLRMAEKGPRTKRVPAERRILGSAVPLALADNLRTGISTVEQIMVPKRLALYPSITSPLAVFGTIYGMVFPLLMFPAAILYGLNELLIPELARCRAAGSETRIHYLVRKSLRVGLFYGLFCSGLLFLNADALCSRLYHNGTAGHYLKLLAPLAVMLYSDSVTDAMIKGLGQQKASVRYNILTNAMDVCMLFFLLPKYGIAGYFFSFVISHTLNFYLSLGRLLKISGQRISVSVPAVSLLMSALVIAAVKNIPSVVIRSSVYFASLLFLLFLSGILDKKDADWIRQLIIKK